MGTIYVIIAYPKLLASAHVEDGKLPEVFKLARMFTCQLGELPVERHIFHMEGSCYNRLDYYIRQAIQ